MADIRPSFSGACTSEEAKTMMEKGMNVREAIQRWGDPSEVTFASWWLNELSVSSPDNPLDYVLYW